MREAESVSSEETRLRNRRRIERRSRSGGIIIDDGNDCDSFFIQVAKSDSRPYQQLTQRLLGREIPDGALSAKNVDLFGAERVNEFETKGSKYLTNLG